MIFFLYIFFVIAFLVQVLNTSLLNTYKHAVIASLIPASICLGFYSFSLSQNNQFIDWISKQPNLISAVAVFQTLEATLLIFLTFFQIRKYYKRHHSFLWKLVSLIPSVQYLIGLIFLQTVLFIQIDGYNYIYIALTFFAIVFIMNLSLSIGIKKWFSLWEVRAELKSTALIFQILLAMFLPLVAKGLHIPYTQLYIDNTSIVITIGSILIVGFYGFYKQKITHDGTYE